MADHLCDISVEQLSSAVSDVVHAECSTSDDQNKNRRKQHKAKKVNKSVGKKRGSNLSTPTPHDVTCIGIVSPESGRLLLPIPRLPMHMNRTNGSPSVKAGSPENVVSLEGAAVSGRLQQTRSPPAYDSTHFTVTLAHNSSTSHVSTAATNPPPSTAVHSDHSGTSQTFYTYSESLPESTSQANMHLLTDNTVVNDDDNGNSTMTTAQDTSLWKEDEIHVKKCDSLAMLSANVRDKTSDLGSGIAKENSLMGLQNLVVTHLRQQGTSSLHTSSMEDLEEGNDAATTVIELLHVVEDEQRTEPTSSTDIAANTIIMSAYCIECNKVWPSGCPHHIHTYSHVPDSHVPTRARATLPSLLALHSLHPSNSPNFTGIVASIAISSRTVFGPLEGKRTTKDQLERPEDTAYVWELFRPGHKAWQVLDCRDEAHSNWLMFIKRARWSHEQNMVVYQHGDDIYFVTRCDVAAGEELLYWYSSDYANMLGVASSPELLFPCPKCKKAYSNLPALQRHDARAHPDTASRKHTCTLCDKAFSTTSKLRQHSLTHNGHKPFPCTLCNKSFNVASNLKVHMRTHTNERKFQCELCDKAFVQKSQLTLHQLVHTGTKRYKCDYCPRVFARPGDRSLHENTHTNKHIYVCEVCNKRFYKLQNLRKHEKIHAGQRDWPCPQCQSKFSSKYHMKRHLGSCKQPASQPDPHS